MLTRPLAAGNSFETSNDAMRGTLIFPLLVYDRIRQWPSSAKIPFVSGMLENSGVWHQYPYCSTLKNYSGPPRQIALHSFTPERFSSCLARLFGVYYTDYDSAFTPKSRSKKKQTGRRAKYNRTLGSYRRKFRKYHQVPHALRHNGVVGRGTLKKSAGLATFINSINVLL